MGCGGSKAAPKAEAPSQQKETQGLLGKEQEAAVKKGNVAVHGVPASMNCLGPILLTTAAGCGKMEQCMPFQDTNKPEFLAINPFHTVPAIKDGEYCLGESNAVLRFVAETYAQDAYPADAKLRGFIDWAMDRFSSAMYSDCVGTVYPLLGFAGPPTDQAAAGKKCTENLEEFAKVFLKNKFVGGDKLSIADYKIAPFFFCYEHAAVQEKSLVVCPDRIKQFNKDFAAACGAAAGIMTSAGGYSLKEMLDAKLDKKEEPAAAETKKAEEPAAAAPETPAAAAPAPAPEAKDEAAKAKPECVIYGVAPSMNCLGAILLVTAGNCGKMEMCMPYQDTTKPEFLAINPFHAVPALKDGDYCLAESSAILRYVSTYVPDTYPNDTKVRGFINWAMDRFSGAMYSDAYATIYPLLGFAEAPADKEAAAKKCTENLEEFGKVFLKAKFVGGEKLSIADYKVAPFFFCYEHAALKEKSGVDCPDRIKQFNKDFAAACGEATAILSSAGGYSLKEMLDAKLAPPAEEPKSVAPEPAAEPAKEEPKPEEKPKPVEEAKKEPEEPIKAVKEVETPSTSPCCA